MLCKTIRNSIDCNLHRETKLDHLRKIAAMHLLKDSDLLTGDKVDEIFGVKVLYVKDL